MSNALDGFNIEGDTKTEEPGLVGFICPKSGRNEKFDYCFKECKNQCEPLPVLIAMSSHRKIVEGTYSVTEILNPPQIVHLQRNFPYYVIPKSRAFVTFGTGWHTLLEQQKHKIKELRLEDDYIIENNNKPFEVKFDLPAGTAILRGTPDLYHIPTKTLWDFKTMKYYYTLKYLLENNSWGDSTIPLQVNMYRKYCFPESEKMMIEGLVKDYNRQIMWKGIEPIVQVEVPFIINEHVEEIVKTKLNYLLECQKDPSKVRECTIEEIWVGKNKRTKDFGKPMRCMDYCNVSLICPQNKGKADAT